MAPFRLHITTTKEQEIIDITERLQLSVGQYGFADGILSLFLPHTSAGLTTAGTEMGTEVNTMKAFDQPGDKNHLVLSSLLGVSLSIPVERGQILLGAYQRVALVELNGPQERTVIVSFMRSEK